MMFLDVDRPPVFAFSHDRQFESGEKHITRRCPEDVIVFIYSGILRFTEDGAPVEVHPGEYYIQRSQLFQQGEAPSDSPHYYYIHFHGEWHPSSGIQIHGNYPSELLPLLARMDELCRMGASRLSISAVFYELLSLLPTFSGTAPHQQLAESIRLALHRSASQEVSLQKLSRQFHFSPNYLIRVFRAAYGQTPYEYLTRLRLEKAEQLMRYSGLSIKAIAAECGFGSYVNLYKAFHKYRGMSPLEWEDSRKKNQAEDVSSTQNNPK